MNTQVKHTPGPWKAMKKAIQPKDGLFYCMVHEDKEDQSVAPAKGFGLTREEAVANAALIAAAPAMYEAGSLSLDIMERVAQALERMGNEGLRSIVRSAIIEQKTALALAEGK